MRVLLVSDSYAPQVNGVAISVRILARSLHEAGHTVAVYTVRTRPRSGDGASEDYPVVRRPALPLPLNNTFSVAAPIDREALRLVERFRPDVTHCHSPFGMGWQGLRAGLARGVPVMGTHHTLFAQYVECYSRLGHRANRRVATMFRRYVAAFYNRCDFVTCASQFLAMDLVSGGLVRAVKVIPNAVDTSPFGMARRAERCGDEVRLVFCGRLAPEKNLFRLLDLLEPTLRRSSIVRLQIVGDGPLKRDLERDVARRGLERQVVFTGWLHGEELATAIASADIGVSASMTENQPLALLESMAAGLPVVALGAAGVPEIIEHGANGYVVEPAAARSRFTEMVERLVAAPELRVEMGQRASAFAQRNSVAAHTTATLAAYEETVARAQRRLKRQSPFRHSGRGITRS